MMARDQDTNSNPGLENVEEQGESGSVLSLKSSNIRKSQSFFLLNEWRDEDLMISDVSLSLLRISYQTASYLSQSEASIVTQWPMRSSWLSSPILYQCSNWEPITLIDWAATRDHPPQPIPDEIGLTV